ncbi:hypothetical protein Cflav_PD1719 [Pedosphaera parvula Ellin514]|uniref:Uncharacterized protein n=1 Tax=Pedosphaera parvula (strain Ellin514) TaxID=320771 RepID=B9XNI9_PEDPL|nr:hypothetical protein Cflav_PD1719 [Pedosphaera parvula Ellin514]
MVVRFKIQFSAMKLRIRSVVVGNSRQWSVKKNWERMKGVRQMGKEAGNQKF